MRICIIFNPAAQGEKATRFQKFLEGCGTHCCLKPTPVAGAARALAAEAVREGFGTIVAAGGDGTVNEVLNGIGDEPDGFARARLGVLPVGTVNVFAKELGLPLKVSRAWQTVLLGREITIDLPRITLTNQGAVEQRHFVQMAGAGWDARAVEMVDWKLKKRIGQLAYVISGWKALQGEHAQMTIRSASTTVAGELVIVGNGRFYGGKVPIFHQADYQDGLLDVCVFPKVNWFSLLRYVVAYLAHRLIFRRSEYYFQTSAFHIEADGDVPVEVDGEIGGRLPAACSIQNRVLRVVVP